MRFRRSRIAQEHSSCRKSAQGCHERAARAVSENRAEDPQPRLGQHRFGCLVRSVTQSDVRQFVRHYASKLRLIVSGLDRAAVHKHVSAGQGKRVDGLVIHAMKFERVLHSARWQLLRQARAQLCQVSIHFWRIARR